METVILIGTGVVALGAVVLICLLLKMIVTRDYSLLVGEDRHREVGQSHSHALAESPDADSIARSPVPEQQLWPFGAFDLEVAHFLPELRDSAQKRKVAEGLLEIEAEQRRQAA